MTRGQLGSRQAAAVRDAHREADDPQDEQQQDEQQREGQQDDEQADAAARDPQDALQPARDLNPLRLHEQPPPPIPSAASADRILESIAREPSRSHTA